MTEQDQTPQGDEPVERVPQSTVPPEPETPQESAPASPPEGQEPEAKEPQGAEAEAQPTDGATDTPTDAGEPRKPGRAETRIAQLTGEKHALQADRDYWRDQALAKGQEPATAAPTPAPEPEAPPQRPKLDDFDSDEAYQDAVLKYADDVADYKARQARREWETATKASAQQAAAQTAAEERNARWNEKQNDARGRLENYDAIALNPTVPVTEDMAQVIQDSDTGPDLLYHLGLHPEKAARIAQKPAHLQAAALGRLAAEIAIPQSKPNSAAPEPVDTVGAGSETAGEKDLYDPSLPMDEYARRSRERDAKRRRY